MAKTRPKPLTAKKSTLAGASASEGTSDIRLISLNVRKVAPGASDDAKHSAGIRETGIKQNLVYRGRDPYRARVSGFIG